MRPIARLWLSALLVGVLLMSSFSSAMAGNWGAGINNENWNCLARGDTNPKEYKSECTTEDKHLYVYIFTTVPEWWKQDLIDSIHQDYGPISDFSAYRLTSSNSFTDVYVMPLSVPDSWPYGIYTTCENHYNQGGGSGEYRWCDEQIIVVDASHDWVVNNNIPTNASKQRYLACHELGHTTGLLHPANLHSDRITCMDYDQHDVLHDHDVEHLNDCYPRPSPPPATRTTSCRVS